MYIPAAFAETDTAALHGLIAAHPFGTLVTHGAQGLDATHVPFLLAADQGPQGTLLTHIARANPLWQQHADGEAVLVVFSGPQGYVSPNWYPSKHETHRQVPTWNYQVVHAHGRLRIRDDERHARGLLARLTREHETRSQQSPPWKMGDAPPDYLSQHLKGLVCLDVEIDRLVGVSKLNQNKADADRKGVVQGLAARGETALAQAMRDAGACPNDSLPQR